jgi:hypothetical protein
MSFILIGIAAFVAIGLVRDSLLRYFLIGVTVLLMTAALWFTAEA